MKKLLRVIILNIIIFLALSISIFAIEKNATIVIGDADKNNIIDENDVKKILDIIALNKLSNNNAYEESADINLDGKIDLVDSITVMRYIKARDEGIHPEWLENLKREIKFGVKKDLIEIDLSNNEQELIEIIGENYGNVSFESSNLQIATVDENGNVIGVSNGEANITVKEDLGNLEVTCNVIVKTSPKSLSIVNNNGVLKVGEEIELTKNIYPTTANSNNKITWGSSNENIATVDENGKITGKATGKVTITAITENDKNASTDLIVGPNNDYIDVKSKLEDGNLNTFIENIQTDRTSAYIQSFDIANWITTDGKERNYLFISQNSSNKGNFITKMTYDVNTKSAEKESNMILGRNELYWDNNNMECVSDGHNLSVEINPDRIGMWIWYGCQGKGVKFDETWNVMYGVPDSKLCKLKYYANERILNKSNEQTETGEIPSLAPVDGDNCPIYDGELFEKFKIDSWKMYDGDFEIDNPQLSTELHLKRFTGYAFDANNDLMVICRGSYTNQQMYIYKFSDFKKNGIERANIISSFTHTLNGASDDSDGYKSGDKNTRQGIAIDGSYIYIYENTIKEDGTSTIYNGDWNNSQGDTYISIYDISGKCVLKRCNIEQIASSSEFFEEIRNGKRQYSPGGIKVYNGKVYIGYGVENSDKICQNILYIKGEDIEPTGVSLNQNEAEIILEENKPMILKAEIAPYNANTINSIEWTSSDNSVATVKNGVVTGIKKGTAEITVRITSDKYSFENSCNVTVSGIIGLNENKVNIEKNKLSTFVTNVETERKQAALQNFDIVNYKDENEKECNYLFISQNSSAKGNFITKMEYDATTKTATGLSSMNLQCYDDEEFIGFSHGSNLDIEYEYDENGNAKNVWLWYGCNGEGMKYNDNEEIKEWEYKNIGEDGALFKFRYLEPTDYEELYDNRDSNESSTTIMLRNDNDDELYYYEKTVWVRPFEGYGNYENIGIFENNLIDNKKKMYEGTFEINKNLLSEDLNSKRFTGYSIDQKNDLIVVARGPYANQNFQVYNFSDFKENGIGGANIISSFTHTLNGESEDSDGYKTGDKNYRQGLAICGNYVYLYENTVLKGVKTSLESFTYNNNTYYNEHGDTYISIYDINTGDSILYRKRLELKGTEFFDNISDKNNTSDVDGKYIINNKYISYEPEGMKIYDGVIYIGYGIKTKADTDLGYDKYQTILYFGDKLSVAKKTVK